jgi:cytochrome bd ubiquinol oxidase subunit II
VFYAIFGGADFGAGFWDLTAGGARRGTPRWLIDESFLYRLQQAGRLEST